MPATAGIHVVTQSRTSKTWIPAFAGMTRWGRSAANGQPSCRR